MNFEDNIRRLQDAQGDPHKLALVTVDIVCAHRPDLGLALEVAAVPHWFDAEVLSTLLRTSAESTEGILKELRSLPMIESFPARNGWNVNKTTRIALRRQLAREKAGRLREVSACAASYFQADDPTRQIETIYHRLVAFPEDGANELEQLYRDWGGGERAQELQTLSLNLDELITDGLLEPIARAGVLLFLCRVGGARAVEDHAREAARLFCEIGDPDAEVEARNQLGDILSRKGKRDEALREFEACKEILLHQVTHHQVSFLAGCLIKEKDLRGHYDVFLSYNSQDKEAVISIASNLMQVGLKPWLDEWDLISSKPWMPQLEEALSIVRCTAVFVGKNGIGPWEEKERQTALDIAVRSETGIVVVLLPDALEKPAKLPGFLGGYPIISLRGQEKTEPQSFNNLVLGIMGERPGNLRERAVDAALVAEVQARRRDAI